MVRGPACSAGVGWATETHHLCVVTGDGSKPEECTFRQSGKEQARMAEWIAAQCSGHAFGTPVPGRVFQQIAEPVRIAPRATDELSLNLHPTRGATSPGSRQGGRCGASVAQRVATSSESARATVMRFCSVC